MTYPLHIIIVRDKRHNGRLFTEGELMTEEEAREAVRDWQGLGWTVDALLQQQPDGTYKPVAFEELSASHVEEERERESAIEFQALRAQAPLGR